MKGPKYVESNIVTIVKREQEYMSHLKSLNKIQSDPYLQKELFSKPQMKQNKILEKIKENKQNNRNFNEAMKYRQIYHQNQKLNVRIFEILSRDKRKIRSQGYINETRIGSASSSKSLNLTYRKKVANQIANENNQLMGRLLQTSSTIKSKKILDKDFLKQRADRERISKLSITNQSRMQSLILNGSVNNSLSSLRLNGLQKVFSTKEKKFVSPNNMNQMTYQGSHFSKSRISNIQKLKLPPIKK